MHSTQMLNLDTTGSARVEEDTPLEGDEFAKIRQLIEQTRSDLHRAQVEIDQQQEVQASQQRRGKLLYIVLAVLIVVLAGASWFVYPMVRDRNSSVSQMLGLQNGAKALGERVDFVEANLNTAAGSLPSMASRMDELQATMKSNFDSVLRQAQGTVTQLGQRLRDDLDKGMQLMQSRLAGVESNQREASEHVNLLEEQVATLKRELASMRDQSSAANDQIKLLQDEQQSRSKALAGLDQRMASNQAVLDSVVNRTDRKRIDFDIDRQRTQEIAPGIYLTIRRADTRNQEIDGTLQLAAESRMLSIRGQGLRKPLLFYASDDNRPMELVLTDVAKNRVSGYVSIPVALTASTKPDNGAQ